MKWSTLLHAIAAIAGIVGLGALIGTWIASVNGQFLGMTEEHLFNDATGFFLASIAFGIGTLIHLKTEK